MLLRIIFLCMGLWTVAKAQPAIPDCAHQKSVRVVVIGSSTAAGSGASSAETSWVGRYKNYLKSINPQNEVINIARGGYTTYHLMETGFVTPTGRHAVDTARNISRAISFQPDAIIINLPSNDMAYGVEVGVQLSNFEVMRKEAEQYGIPVWICSAQPRNFRDEARRNGQRALHDAIMKRYDSLAIDFWTKVSTTEHRVRKNLDAGDGVHLNDKGHALLFKRVKNSGLLATITNCNGQKKRSVESWEGLDGRFRSTRRP